jgi:CheY-like chemotaxis protein
MHPSRASARSLNILLVEDDDAQAQLVERVVEDARLNCALHHVQRGAGALAFVRRSSPFRRAPRPDLVLLDAKLSDIDGLAVLAALKRSPVLRVIPVLLFSASGEDHELLCASRLHANGYLVKPLEFDALREMLADICRFWRWNRQPPLLDLPPGVDLIPTNRARD